jgi:hypothetical protein
VYKQAGKRNGRLAIERLAVAVIVLSLILAGCSSKPEAGNDSWSAVIGVSGGSLRGPDGAFIDVPPGALTAPTKASITQCELTREAGPE